MDLNNDGFKDILSGSYSRSERPMAGLFQVLWGQKDGTFKQAATLNGADGKPLVIPCTEETLVDAICTRAFAIDFDGDGDLDIITGNFIGTFFIFTGEGDGRFSPQCAKLLDAAGEPLKVTGAHSDPFIIDFDGDGDLDIISGSGGGGIQWSQNTAGKGKTPAMKPFATLIAPHGEGRTVYHEPPSRPDDSLRVWVTDFNGDKKLDLLVGDSVSISTRAEGLTDEQFEQKQAAWQKEYDAAVQAYEDAHNGDTRRAAINTMRNIAEKRNEFIKEQNTGFVWLYLGK